MPIKCENGHPLPSCEKCEKEAAKKRVELARGVKAGITDALLVPALFVIVVVVARILIGW